MDIPQLEFTVRPAAPEYAEALCALHVASIREICSPDYTPEQIDGWTLNKHPAIYANRMIKDGVRFHIAVADDELLGFVDWSGDEVYGLYVSPGAVGRGVGSALLALAEAGLAASGVEVVRLNATLTAIPFYAARGYRETCRGTRTMGGVEVPCVGMEKRLTGKAASGCSSRR